jgi:hypothetical protein
MDKISFFVQYQWTRFNNNSIERAHMNIEAAITRYIDLSPPSDAVQREVTLSSSFDFIVSIRASESWENNLYAGIQRKAECTKRKQVIPEL